MADAGDIWSQALTQVSALMPFPLKLGWDVGAKISMGDTFSDVPTNFNYAISNFTDEIKEGIIETRDATIKGVASGTWYAAQPFLSQILAMGFASYAIYVYRRPITKYLNKMGEFK